MVGGQSQTWWTVFHETIINNFDGGCHGKYIKLNAANQCGAAAGCCSTRTLRPGG